MEQYLPPSTSERGGRRSVMFVSGGSRGIGRSIVLLAARQGYDVAFTYLSNQDSAELVAGEAAKFGASVLPIRADMTEQESVRFAFNQVVERYGRLDSLINNSGTIGAARSIANANAAHLEAVFRANVFSVFYACAEGVRLMSTELGGTGGTIVNMSSAAARHGGLKDEAHYASSKGAVDSLTLALAKELPAQGIRVNALRPGVIRTSIHDIHGGDDMIARAIPTIPLARAGEPGEVAEAAIFLAGSTSAYINGVILDVSGGR